MSGASEGNAGRVDVAVESRVAALPCWQGAIENTQEIPLLIKTTQARYAAVEAVVRRLHPYELPEIIAVPLAQGLPGYLQWVRDTVSESREA